jgi:hypothetical protein
MGHNDRSIDSDVVEAAKGFVEESGLYDVPAPMKIIKMLSEAERR